MVNIYPSLITADIMHLEKIIKRIEPYCAGFHLDIMDFHFVPNLTWGFDIVNRIREITPNPLNIHLMVDNPEKYIDRLKLNPGDIISIHYESPSALSIAQNFNLIRSYGYLPSLAINPSTPLEAIVTLSVKLEHLLLMCVNPGFSGQKFLTFSLDRLKALNLYRKSHNLSFTISCDGGVNQDNFKSLIDNGANQLIVGSSVMHQQDEVKALLKYSK